MVEAFRCLREEDKTNVELAIMYKEEGNEWMKKKVKKDLKEAIIRYTHALGFLDADDKEQEEKEDDEPTVVLLDEEEDDDKEKKKGIKADNSNTKNNVLRSQILNNRALASMHLKNYGTALGDINMVGTVCLHINVISTMTSTVTTMSYFLHCVICQDWCQLPLFCNII